MKRKILIGIGATLAVVLLAAAALVAYVDHRLIVDLPDLRSDVAVLGVDDDWSPAVELRVDTLQARVVFAVLNLFNWHAVVEFRIRGTLQSRSGERPAVAAVRIVRERRFVRDRREQARGNIALFPVIEVEEDPTQPRMVVPFDTRVQVELRTLKFGINHFTVTAGDQTAEFELLQGK